VLLIERGAELRIGQQAGLQDLRLSHAALIPQRAQLRADDDAMTASSSGVNPSRPSMAIGFSNGWWISPPRPSRLRPQAAAALHQPRPGRVVAHDTSKQPVNRPQPAASIAVRQIALNLWRSGSATRLHNQNALENDRRDSRNRAMESDHHRHGAAAWQWEIDTLTRGRSIAGIRACRVARSRAG